MAVKTPINKGKKIQRDFLSANVILSITIALFIFGLCGLLILQANKLGELVKQNIEIQIFLQNDLESSEITILQQAIIQKEYIYFSNQEAQVSFISKEQASKDFIKETGEDFTELIGENPLRDAFIVKIKAEWHEPEKMQEIAQDLENLDGVYEVSYVENLIQDIHQNVATISFFLSLFGLFVLITVIILIDNTIKIALFSQRFLIRSMQLVGATNAFIRKPFLVRALVQGLVGGILASLTLILFLNYMQSLITELTLLYDFKGMVILISMLISAGAIIAVLSALRSVQKYLHTSLDSLY